MFVHRYASWENASRPGRPHADCAGPAPDRLHRSSVELEEYIRMQRRPGHPDAHCVGRAGSPARTPSGCCVPPRWRRTCPALRATANAPQGPGSIRLLSTMEGLLRNLVRSDQTRWQLGEFKTQGHDALHSQIRAGKDSLSVGDVPPPIRLNVLLSELIDRLAAGRATI